MNVFGLFKGNLLSSLFPPTKAYVRSKGLARGWD
jgi:hypothetical protein